MKKILSMLISVAILSGCACAFSACAVNEPVEQINNMIIKSVSQSAYGSVMVTLDVGGVDFSDDGGEKYYYVQPSLDGGQNWCEGTVYLTQSAVENGEFSFNLAEYSSFDGSYYLFGSQDAGSRLSLSAGNKIELSLRFKGHDNYLVSSATQTVEYVIKSVTEFDIFGASVDGNLPGLSGTPYIFVKQQDDSFKLFKLIGSESNLTEAESEILGRLEYKFISESELEEIGNMSVLNGELKELENSTQTSGWIAYSSENGITAADCEGKLNDNSDRQPIYGSDNEEIGYTEFENEYALLMVRLKGMDGELKSEVALVYLYTKNSINEYYYD